MENVLEKKYEQWRNEQESFAFDGIATEIDSGEQSAREDFFDNFLDVKLDDKMAFQVMKSLEEHYEKENGTLNLEKCKLALNEEVLNPTPNWEIEQIVEDVIKNGSRNSDVAEENLNTYKEELLEYAKNFKSLIEVPEQKDILLKEIELLTKMGKFNANEIDNVEKTLENLENAGYNCHLENDYIHLDNWNKNQELGQISKKEIIDLLNDYCKSIDPWCPKISLDNSIER